MENVHLDFCRLSLNPTGILLVDVRAKSGSDDDGSGTQ